MTFFITYRLHDIERLFDLRLAKCRTQYLVYRVDDSYRRMCYKHNLHSKVQFAQPTIMQHKELLWARMQCICLGNPNHLTISDLIDFESEKKNSNIVMGRNEVYEVSLGFDSGLINIEKHIL